MLIVLIGSVYFETILDVLNSKDKDTLLETIIRIQIHELIENKENNYSLGNIEELAEDIEMLGLLQPLLVKPNDDDTYTIIAGHRRYNAIKHLIKENKLDEDYLIMVKVIELNENEIETELKLHSTNLQTRSLLKLEEEEKLAIVENYMRLIEKAKEQGVKINGKEVKGKTRDILAEQLNIGERTAGRLIAKVKERQEGGQMATPPKSEISTVDKLRKIIKQMEKLEIDNSEEELQLKGKIKELLG